MVEPTAQELERLGDDQFLYAEYKKKQDQRQQFRGEANTAFSEWYRPDEVVNCEFIRRYWADRLSGLLRRVSVMVGTLRFAEAAQLMLLPFPRTLV